MVDDICCVRVTIAFIFCITRTPSLRRLFSIGCRPGRGSFNLFILSSRSCLTVGYFVVHTMVAVTDVGVADVFAVWLA